MASPAPVSTLNKIAFQSSSIFVFDKPYTGSIHWFLLIGRGIIRQFSLIVEKSGDVDQFFMV